MNQKIQTRQLAVAAMLSATAFILQYFELSIPLMPSYIAFDFSDLPAIIGAFALGPVYGIVIELVKNILHLIVSKSMFIGELSNFILGAIFAFVTGGLYRIRKTKRNALIAGVAGAIVMGCVSVLTNYFIVYPVYVAAFFGGNESICITTYDAISYDLLHLGHMNSLLQCLVCFNLPFTIVKGLICVGITMLIYQPLRPLLKGRKE